MDGQSGDDGVRRPGEWNEKRGRRLVRMWLTE